MSYIPADLRRFIITCARQCCEYCLLLERYAVKHHEIDHIIAERHRGKTVASNLCFACYYCNHYKGTDFGSFDPDTNAVTMLFNPRQDKWIEHFQLDGATIEALTPQGRITVFLLHLNDPQRLDERAFLIKLKRYPPNFLSPS